MSMMNYAFYDKSYWSTSDIQKDELLHKLYDISIDALDGLDENGDPKASVSVNFGNDDVIYLQKCCLNIHRYPLRFIAIEIAFPGEDAHIDIRKLHDQIKARLSGPDEPVLLIEAIDEGGNHIMQADAPSAIFLGASSVEKACDRLIVIYNDDNVIFREYAGEEEESEEENYYA